MIRCYLGPWTWVESPARSYWAPPAGTVGAVDLRPLPAQAQSGAGGATPQGCGFFASTQTLGSGYLLVGEAEDRAALEQLELGASLRTQWSQQLGIRPLSSGRLIDCLFETLTSHADPQGQTFCPPLMPDRRRDVRLHLGELGLLKRQRIRADLDDALFRKVLAVERINYAAIRQASLAGNLSRPVQTTDGRTLAVPDRQFHRRYLKALIEKYSTFGPGGAPSRAIDYRLFQSDLPDETPLPHGSSIADDFDRADNTSLGNSSHGWSWNTFEGGLQILGEQFTGNTSGDWGYARAEIDLASDDHSSRITVTTPSVTANASIGVLARIATGATPNRYYGEFIVSGGGTYAIYKRVGGTWTGLGSAGGSIAAADTVELQCSGSDIILLRNGVRQVAAADTAITGNLRCGILASGINLHRGDDFLAADLATPGSVDTRVTTFGYDFRNRRTVTDGEIDFYSKTYFDNMDRVVKTERYDTTSAGNLIARGETFFDDRSRVYETKTYAVNPSNGDVGNALVGGNWYDEASNVIKSIAPGAGVVYTKSEYDSLGRAVRSFTAYDDSGDVILEESLTTYDDVSNVLVVTGKQRDTDAATFRSTFAASWYDGIDRPTASANYGTNGGSSFTRPTTTPTRSDTVLVTSTEYDAATGEAFKTTDPKALVTKREFDDAGRTVTVVENFVQSGTDPDQNRTTEFTYNADGNQETITAVNAATGDQVTTYIYGTTLSDSAIASNLLLRAIEYPTDTSVSRVEMKYNRQGQVTERKDQAGTTHAYDYDKLGRQVQDRVLAVGTDIDEAVLRIATTYEVRGMVESITCYDTSDLTAPGGLTPVNQVLFEYNTFGQLIEDYQSHDDEVDTGTTPKTQYAYATGGSNSNQIRPTSITYPDGRVIDYSYGTSGETDDKLNRLAAIKDNATNLAAYKYLGLGTVVVVDYTEPQVKLDLWGGSAGAYTGLDRFGRVIDHRWIDYGASPDEDVARIEHGYDRNSNRLWRQNDVARALSKKFDQQYVYDGLNRLIDAKTGLLNGSQVIPNGDRTFEQQWSLDKLGNWAGFNQDDDGDGDWDLEQERTQNEVNEITDITATTGPVWTTPVYDPAGNTTNFPKPAAPTESFTVVYDAWNRMVRVTDDENADATVQENVYDGRGYRIVKKTYDAGVLDKTRHIYYTSSWQAIEERLGTDPDAADPERQHVWGVRYIDDLILRDRDTSDPLDGTLDETLYAVQDSNWNVTTIIDEAGDVQERFEYDSYGFTHFVDATFDVQPQSTLLWTLLFSTYLLEESVGNYYVRNRTLHSLLGLWLQRDPLRYINGNNLCEYAASNGINLFDPYGTNWAQFMTVDYWINEWKINIDRVGCGKGAQKAAALANKAAKGIPRLAGVRFEAAFEVDYVTIELGYVYYDLPSGRAPIWDVDTKDWLNIRDNTGNRATFPGNPRWRPAIRVEYGAYCYVRCSVDLAGFELPEPIRPPATGKLSSANIHYKSVTDKDHAVELQEAGFVFKPPYKRSTAKEADIDIPVDAKKWTDTQAPIWYASPGTFVGNSSLLAD